VSVADPVPPTVRLTELGLVDAEIRAGFTDTERLTVPEKFLMLANAMVKEGEVPRGTVAFLGVAAMVKSPVTLADIIVVWVRGPLPPAIVTV
jgi:hypothetical protein